MEPSHVGRVHSHQDQKIHPLNPASKMTPITYNIALYCVMLFSDGIAGSRDAAAKFSFLIAARPPLTG